MSEVPFVPDMTALQIQINRGFNGLSIYARSNHRVEEFFKAVSGNVAEDVDLRVHGRHWVTKNNPPILKMYNISHEAQLMNTLPVYSTNVSGYRFNAPGKRLSDVDPSTLKTVVNLSFLRCVGISEEGVKLNIRGLYSDPEVKNIRDVIIAATNEFCDAFLRPINFTINIVES